MASDFNEFIVNETINHVISFYRSVRLFPLPIGEQDELKVVKDVRANLTKNVVSNVMMMRALTGVVGTMPYSWVQKSGFTDIIGIPLVVSEFPGPTKQISGFGLPLVEISFQVGFHKGNCGECG